MSQEEMALLENMAVPLGRVGIILATCLPHRDVVKVCDSVFLKGFEGLLQ